MTFRSQEDYSNITVLDYWILSLCWADFFTSIAIQPLHHAYYRLVLGIVQSSGFDAYRKTPNKLGCFWQLGKLKMYCIDTKALVFIFNGGTPYGFTIRPIFTRIPLPRGRYKLLQCSLLDTMGDPCRTTLMWLFMGQCQQTSQ